MPQTPKQVEFEITGKDPDLPASIIFSATSCQIWSTFSDSSPSSTPLRIVLGGRNRGSLA